MLGLAKTRALSPHVPRVLAESVYSGRASTRYLRPMILLPVLSCFERVAVPSQHPQSSQHKRALVNITYPTPDTRIANRSPRHTCSCKLSTSPLPRPAPTPPAPPLPPPPPPPLRVPRPLSLAIIASAAALSSSALAAPTTPPASFRPLLAVGPDRPPAWPSVLAVAPAAASIAWPLEDTGARSFPDQPVVSAADSTLAAAAAVRAATPRPEAAAALAAAALLLEDADNVGGRMMAPPGAVRPRKPMSPGRIVGGGGGGFGLEDRERAAAVRLPPLLLLLDCSGGAVGDVHPAAFSVAGSPSAAPPSPPYCPRGITAPRSFPPPLARFGADSSGGIGTYFIVNAACRPSSRNFDRGLLPSDGGGVPIGSALINKNGICQHHFRSHQEESVHAY